MVLNADSIAALTTSDVVPAAPSAMMVTKVPSMGRMRSTRGTGQAFQDGVVHRQYSTHAVGDMLARQSGTGNIVNVFVQFDS